MLRPSVSESGDKPCMMPNINEPSDALFVTRGRVRRWMILTVISLGLWIVFAKFVVPAVIQSAYRGESWSFLNRMITGQATHPVSEYIRDWDTVIIPALLVVLGFWLIV